MSNLNRRAIDRMPRQTSDHSFEQCPRYDAHELTDEQVAELIEKAVTAAILKYAEKMTDVVQEELENRFYSSIGKTVMNKVYYVLGIAFFVLIMWLSKMGYLKL